ncbi:MAG: hypothetical protein PF588_03160, partial [Candidatus Kapabacteria bacterium]|nr:hypothetical protein [Candidatus Kapabacteria bacterium]
MKLFITTIIFAMLATLSTQAQYIPHPYNLDFERGNPGTLPEGWSVEPTSAKKGYKATVSNQEFKTGTQSLEFSYLEDEDDLTGSMFQRIDAKQYRGKTIVFRAAVKADVFSNGGQAFLYLISDIPKRYGGEPDEFTSEGIVGDWEYYQIVCEISAVSDYIIFGAGLTGAGKVYIDDISFEIDTKDSESYFTAPEPISKRSMENISAFAKMAGYVRYFYPGTDAIIDWDRFITNGIEYVEGAKNTKNLAKIMNDLFCPVAPGLEIYKGKPKKKSKKVNVRPKEAVGDYVLACRHDGPALDGNYKDFSSSIMNLYEPTRLREGSVIQIASGEELAGKDIVLSARILNKTDDDLSSEPQMFVQIDGAKGTKPDLYLLETKVAKSRKWKTYSLEIKARADARIIRTALVLVGEGKALFDDVKLTIKADSVDNKNYIRHQGFEEYELGSLTLGWKMQNSAIAAGYKAEIVPKGYRSKKCLSISASTENKIKVIKNNEVYSRKLNGGISFSMPLTLYMDSVRTLPYPYGCAELQNVKPKDFVMSGSDRSSRLAIVAIVWNLFKHFGLNDNKAKVWDRALKYALQDAAICKNDDQFLEILELLTVEVNDGQSRAWKSKDRVLFSYPFNWIYLDKKVYINKTAADFTEFSPGDQVLSIDGISVKSALKEFSASVSAVRTATRYKATLEKIRLGNKGDEIKLKIRTTSGKTKKVTVRRTYPPADLVPFKYDRFSEKAPGIFYANLTQMNDRGIKLIVKDLVDAKGIIFDLRGSSRVSPEFLGLFADESLDGPEISIPIYMMPDHNMISYKTINKLISAKNPKLDIKVVFLADENT